MPLTMYFLNYSKVTFKSFGSVKCFYGIVNNHFGIWFYSCKTVIFDVDNGGNFVCVMIPFSRFNAIKNSLAFCLFKIKVKLFGLGSSQFAKGLICKIKTYCSN